MLNFKQSLASGLATLTLALTPSSTYSVPPQPNTQGQICVPQDQIEQICRDNYCPPAQECPSRRARPRPRIPRSKCTDHYEARRQEEAANPSGRTSGVGICLHTDDARRLQSLEGVILEKGPDNLCPWGESYHCYELDVEIVEKPVEKPVKDLETERTLEEARRRIRELEGRKPETIHVPGPTIYVPKPKTPEQEVSLSLVPLAQLTSNGLSDAQGVLNVNLRYLHHLSKYFLLGVEGLYSFPLSKETTSADSNGQELLPDGNIKYWTDVQSKTPSSLGGLGSIVGMRVPLAEITNNVSLYGQLLAGLYVLWGREDNDLERTTQISLPDGTTFLGPKTINEPQDRNMRTMLGFSASAEVGVRIPFGKGSSSSALTIGVGPVYFFNFGQENPHHFGGQVTGGVQF